MGEVVSMNGKVIEDDSQVYSISAKKVWTADEQGKIQISIKNSYEITMEDLYDN
jgi:Holliday junction resolvase RusA-like endonuclease